VVDAIWRDLFALTAIDESRGRIAACCHDGATVEADAAILTVPLPLLPEIALPQAVREKAAASTDIGFGNVVKILLRFTAKWWANRGGRDLADLTFLFSSATVPTWWTQHPAKYPVLTGWFAGPKADTVARLTVSELVDMGLASLAEIFDLSLDRITGNSNIEEGLLKDYLTKCKYSPEQISRAIYLLNTEAKNPSRSLYENNKAVYSLLRYGVPVKTEAGKVTDSQAGQHHRQPAAAREDPRAQTSYDAGIAIRKN
jgi:Flavin containing amine oxidoreductase